MSIELDASAQESLIGDRKINQDRCILVEEGEAFLVGLGDGMGGHPRGEAAAQILIETCESYFRMTPQPILNPRGFLTRLLQKAHENILAFGYEQEPAIDPRTTAVVVLVQDGVAHWAHAGDSRLYLLRQNRIQAKTTDHSYVERLKQQGIISNQEQQAHPHRNYVTRCLGGSMSTPEVSVGKHKLEAGDILLLCTDGLWGQTNEQQLLEQVFGATQLSSAIRKLAEDAAQSAFPDSDNTTLIAVRVKQGSAQKQQAPKPQTDKSGGESSLADAIAELQNALNTFENEKKQEKE